MSSFRWKGSCFIPCAVNFLRQAERFSLTTFLAVYSKKILLWLVLELRQNYFLYSWLELSFLNIVFWYTHLWWCYAFYDTRNNRILKAFFFRCEIVLTPVLFIFEIIYTIRLDVGFKMCYIRRWWEVVSMCSKCF